MGLVVPAVTDYIAEVSDERLRSQAFSLLTSSLFVSQFLSPVLSSAFAVGTDGTRELHCLPGRLRAHLLLASCCWSCI